LQGEKSRNCTTFLWQDIVLHAAKKFKKERKKKTVTLREIAQNASRKVFFPSQLFSSTALAGCTLLLGSGSNSPGQINYEREEGIIWTTFYM
jgi:hypothetical protein